MPLAIMLLPYWDTKNIQLINQALLIDGLNHETLEKHEKRGIQDS